MPRAPVRQILSPHIHLLGNSSEAAGAGRAERPGVCPPIPHQAGVALVCLLSCSATLARGGPFPRAHAWLAISRGAPQSLVFAFVAPSFSLLGKRFGTSWAALENSNHNKYLLRITLQQRSAPTKLNIRLTKSSFRFFCNMGKFT